MMARVRYTIIFSNLIVVYQTVPFGSYKEIEACNFRSVRFFQTDYYLFRPNLFTAKILHIIIFSTTYVLEY